MPTSQENEQSSQVRGREERSQTGGGLAQGSGNITALKFVGYLDKLCLTVPPAGGNSGLGAETVRVLAGAGADVILCSRNVSAGQAVADGIAAGLAKRRRDGAPSPGRITVAQLDLADFKSVQAFAQKPEVTGLPSIDLLVLNAGQAGAVLILPRLTAFNKCGMMQIPFECVGLHTQVWLSLVLVVHCTVQASWVCRRSS
jgi:hypothetical protein